MIKSREALIVDIEAMLKALRVPYKQVSLERNLPPIFLCVGFGTIVAPLENIEYSLVLNRIYDNFPGHRFIPINIEDNIDRKREEVLWELMRGGYIRYIRENFPTQFRALIFDHGLGRKIINERLRVWNDLAKYEYLIKENKEALQGTESYILTNDPAFYDFMPEVERPNQEERGNV